MAIMKCKMCGGDVEISPDKTFGTCEYCGNSMTFPKVDDDQRAAAFNRGNHFRRIGEFDKALAVYERIVNEDNTDAEAHWCSALCRFGIEYVEDPATFEWMPTCHRASFDSFLEDVDYKAALEYSDGITRRQYQKDAAKIAEVQKGILATSQNEEPFDVFICYKESEADGQRTKDSVLAQEIYYQLTEQGRRVFFARITLEDKVGAEYEPYIFAALNSAKVMLAIGTAAEHFNAVWVKNEWSRFLALMKRDRSKLLLPCYRDMNPYDLPEGLAVLQSYDMGKIGFIQDLLRGVSKVLDAGKQEPVVQKETVVVNTVSSSGGVNTAALLERVDLFLEDGSWAEADAYCEKVLDVEPKNAAAYLGKLMAELKVHRRSDLKNLAQPFDGKENYKKIIRFCDEALKKQLAEDNAFIRRRNENARLEKLYQEAVHALNDASDEEGCKAAAAKFGEILAYRDAADRRKACLEKAEACRKDAIYHAAQKHAKADSIDSLKIAIADLSQIPGWRDADRLAENCRRRLPELERIKEEEERKAAEKRARIEEEARRKAALLKKEQEARAKRNKKIAIVSLSIAGVAAAAAFTVINVVILPNQYKQASALVEAGQYDEAIAAFEALGGYKDASDRILETHYSKASALVEAGQYHEANMILGEIGRYKNSEEIRRDLMAKTVSAGGWHTVGLKSDGTVVAVGYNKYGQCDVSGWTDIVAIAAGDYHTVGLKSDGTVVAVGKNEYGRCDVSGWTDIVAIEAGGSHTVGLKADGTVVAVGLNKDGQCDVSGWSNIKLPASARNTN